MYLIYVDESGDDGRPGSSTTFSKTAVMISPHDWSEIEGNIKLMRDELRKRYNIPTTIELHTKNLLENKQPFYNYGLSDEQRRNIIIHISEFIASQSFLITNVVIDKERIDNADVKVFEMCVKYLLTRINKTISSIDPTKNFLLFCDKGRIKNWRKVVNKVKTSNEVFIRDIWSKVNFPIDKMIEDPIERESKNSNLIQIADFVVTIIHKYYQIEHKKKTPRSRLSYLDIEFLDSVMRILTPVLNLKAHSNHKYGIVHYPK